MTPIHRRTRAAAAATLVAVLGGCGVSVQDEAERHDPESVPFDLLEPASTTSRPSAGERRRTVEVCLVRGRSLVVLTREADADQPVDVAVRLLEAGPATGLEAQSGLRTEVTEGSVLDVEVAGGVAAVELAEDFAGLSVDAQLLAVAQLVCTLTGQRGVGQVRFTLDGTDVEVPRQDGSLTDGPVTRDDYRRLIES